MRSLGLYIHIPFCKAKCIYCDFYSLPRAEGQMDAYVSALTAQLAAWRERTADCTVDTVYFGGGTRRPSARWRTPAPRALTI